MILNVERLPESLVRLDIAAEEDEFSKAVERAYRRVAAEVAIPGFRKGKAPRAMIERLYGREVYLEEANKELMDQLYRDALTQSEVVPVGDPSVEIEQTEPLAFKVTFPVYPTVEPGPYSDVRVESADASVDESAIDEVIERLRKTQSPWVDPPEAGMAVGPDLVLERQTRTPREGDQVTIDLAVSDAGEAFQEPVEDAVFVLGEDNLFAQLRERIEQLHVGETATLDISFAEDDESVSDKVRGKTLTYTVTLKGLKERDLLPLDDEFAATVGDAETLADLRREIHDDLHQGKTAEARVGVLNEIINQMAEGATIDAPSVMVDEEIEDEIKGLRGRLAQQRLTLEEYLRRNQQTLDELKIQMRPDAARRLRNSLLLREIAKRESIEVSDAELDAEIEAIIAPTEDPNRLRELYSSNYFRTMLRGDLFERRITDRLIEIATEGRGAVVNGWIAPEPEPEPEREPESTPIATEADDERPSALEAALTTGVMAGQPGDIAATATTEDPEAAVAVDDVVAEPDVAQAAAVGHDREADAVSGDVVVDDATGDPGRGGVLADPET